METVEEFNARKERIWRGEEMDTNLTAGEYMSDEITITVDNTPALNKEITLLRNQVMEMQIEIKVLNKLVDKLVDKLDEQS